MWIYDFWRKNFDETLRFTYNYMQITVHSQEINTRKIK